MKVPEPRKLKSGSWFIQLRLDGTSVPVTEATKAGCTQKAQLIKAEYLAGKRKIESGSVILGDLIDQYIEKYSPALSPATVMGYDTIRRNRFKKVMKKPLRDIKDWQAVINGELLEVKEHTVRNAWQLVAAALKDSGRTVPDVKIPRSPANEMAYLEPEEIPLFLAAAEGDGAELELLLALHGLRRSEILSVIQNDRIDLDRGQITVSGAIVPNKDHKLVEKKLNKSVSSTRIVPIMVPRLSVLVKELKDSGKPYPSHSSPVVLRHVHDICKKAGITDVTNHGLRHTFACLGYSLGISERALMELGGWDDPSTMHKIYIRVAQRDKDKAKNEMAEFYSAAANPDPEKLKTEAVSDLLRFRRKYASLEEFKALFELIDSLPEIQNANENANGTQETA